MILDFIKQDKRHVIVISNFFSRDAYFITRGSIVKKYIFVFFISELSTFSSLSGTQLCRDFTSKGSAKPCFQRYFAAMGVIFQRHRRGRIGRIFLAITSETHRVASRRRNQRRDAFTSALGPVQ